MHVMDAQKQEEIDDVAEDRSQGVVSELKDQLGQLKNQFDEFRTNLKR